MSLATDSTVLAGSVTEWMSAIGQDVGAIGTIAAVVVALRLAGRETRQARDRKFQKAEAQALLVTVEKPVQQASSNGAGMDMHHLSARLQNQGERAIVKVIAEAWLKDKSSPQFQRREVVKPGEEPSLIIDLVAAPTADENAAVLDTWRVRWTDLDGYEWCVDQPGQEKPLPFHGQPPRHSSEPIRHCDK